MEPHADGINVERLTREFIRLAEIASPSFRERQIADYLKHRLAGFGLDVAEDDTGGRIGGDAGNIYACLPGDKNRAALFLCAHMDMVNPANGVKVMFQDGVFRSEGSTVLGGDDKAGIAAIIEVLEMLRQQPAPHGDLEILFTVGEEQGLLGSKHFDCSRLKSQFGYVLDSSGDPGTMITAAPAQNKLDITIKGRAAHAGIEPERGINAIQVAGQALARLPLGRIDAETTSNMGVIQGGKATNIIPDSCFIQGEVRSLDRAKMDSLTSRIVSEFTGVAEAAGAGSEVRVIFQYPEFRLDQDLPVFRIAVGAAGKVGLKVGFETSGGGSDANIINATGRTAANLGIGMRQVHTTDEFLRLSDLVADARWLWEIVKQSGE
ncbi:MAG: M20/M25/M40 family metallo-hydrolase [Thermacetogeniaceae bacterium]